MKKAVRIDLKEEKDSKKATASKRSYSSVSRLLHGFRRTKNEFEVTPVISPIFGASDVETNNKRKVQVYSYQKAKSKIHWEAVISPYYGLGELRKWRRQAKEYICKAEEIESEEDFVAFEESEKI